MAAKTPSPQPATPTPKNKEPPPPPMLKTGQVVAAESGNQFVVERLLGKGGFGEVYKVFSGKNHDKTFAMKVEPIKLKGRNNMLRLKVEIHVFDAIAAAPKTIDTLHFVKMHDKGRTGAFKYYVMDVIWLSLKDVIVDICKGVTSPSTKITIARQTLKGVKAMHDLGFLHRDIKAANYAVGLPPNEHVIYMLDFGIARPYREKDGTVKIARARVPFMGTPRYASIRCMEELEQCRKDDLEVWLYMMLEIYDKNNLSWRVERDRKKVLEMKKTMISLPWYAMSGGQVKVPFQYGNIMCNIRNMTYKDEGNFRYINDRLDLIVTEDKIDMKVPLEWVGKKPKSPERPKIEIRKEDSKMLEVKKDKRSMMKEVEEKSGKEDDGTKKGRKKESKKRKKESKADQDEIVIQMEALKDELLREKRRRMKDKGGRTRDDDYWKDEDEDSEDDYSDRDEDYRSGKKKIRKRRSRERARTFETRTRDYSDRDDDREEMDDGDEKEGRRRGRRRSPGGKKKRGKKTYEDDRDERDDREAPRIPELHEDGKKHRDRKKHKSDAPAEDKDDRSNKKADNDVKKKDDKTPEKESKMKCLESPKPDDGAYMVLGDANDQEKAQDVKEKKDQKSAPPAQPSSESVKKSDEASLPKKEAADAKK